MAPRVVINALALSRHHVGGDLTYVLHLARRLVRAMDFEVKVLVQASGAELLSLGPEHLLPVRIPLGDLSRTVRTVFEQVAVPAIIRSVGCDLFHATVNVAPIRCPCPFVLTLHEAEPFLNGIGLPGQIRAWWRFARARSAKNARLIVTVSHTTRNELITSMGIPPGKVVVTPLGVDQGLFWPDAVAGAGWRELFGRYFLWVGVAYPRKNVKTLLEAFASLRRRELRLVLVGPKGWASQALEASISRLGLEKQVVFLGKRVPSELRGLYSGAEALVFPSRQESFGLPILEAMACGTPVIASDIDTFREVADEAAILVDTTSPLVLRDAMEWVLDDCEKAAMLRRFGLERASEYTWERTSAETAQVYRVALGCT